MLSYIFVYEIIRNVMAKYNTPRPTESELEILQVLWQHGPSPVRFVNDELNKQREVGYTTTLKLMQIMVDKGLAARNTDSRTHIYSAAVSEADTQQHLLNRFVDRTFRGSAMKLVMQALGSHKASEEELDEIKALIKQMEDNKDF
jgi:BlaI family transcriptional regulator, penicillinase repressor